MHYGGWGGWLTMTVVGVAFWAAVIWLVVTSVRSGGRGLAAALEGSPRSPDEVLPDRFASGDIVEDEYRSRKALRSTKAAVS